MHNPTCRKQLRLVLYVALGQRLAHLLLSSSTCCCCRSATCCSSRCCCASCCSVACCLRAPCCCWAAVCLACPLTGVDTALSELRDECLSCSSNTFCSRANLVFSASACTDPSCTVTTLAQYDPHAVALADGASACTSPNYEPSRSMPWLGHTASRKYASS